MESIFALAPFTSSRRVRRCTFTSISTFKNQNDCSEESTMRKAATRVNNALHISKSPLVGFPSDIMRHIRANFQTNSCFPRKEPGENYTSMMAGFENGRRRYFNVHHCFAERVRLEDHIRAKSCKQPASARTRCRAKPLLAQPLVAHAKSGVWAKEAIDSAVCKSLISGRHSVSKREEEYYDEFEGYDFEIDRHGNVVRRFLSPPAPSKYDIYNREKFNEDLIFQFDK